MKEKAILSLCALTVSCIAGAQDCAAIIAGPDPIRVCPNSTVELLGGGSTPSGSGTTLTYQWLFEDGTNAATMDTSYLFAHSGFRTATLIVQDDAGCVDSTSISVEVTPKVEIIMSNPGTRCFGDSIAVNTTLYETAYFLYNEQPALLAEFGTTVFTLYVDRFEQEATVTEPSDISTICVEMEHSFMADLEVQITCPNGNTIILHQHGGGGTDLGLPLQGDEINPEPGGCWQYCWGPNAELGTMSESTLTGPVPNVVQTHQGYSLNPGTYSAVGSFSDLVGCPMNGEWTITFMDNWSWDNGYMCNWSIQFAGEETPAPDTSNYRSLLSDLVRDCASLAWEGPGISPFIEPCTSIRALPPEQGPNTYYLRVTDGQGCIHTDSSSVNVLLLSPEIIGPVSAEYGSQTSYTVSEVRPEMSYIWTASSNQVYSWTTTHPQVVFTSYDDNWVAVREYRGACSGRDTLFIERIVSVPEIFSANEVVYPNPADGTLYVALAGQLPQGSFVRVFDTVGRQVLDVIPAFSVDQLTIPTSTLPSGSYMLHIVADAGRRVVPFVVQHSGR